MSLGSPCARSRTKSLKSSRLPGPAKIPARSARRPLAPPSPEPALRSRRPTFAGSPSCSALPSTPGSPETSLRFRLSSTAVQSGFSTHESPSVDSICADAVCQPARLEHASSKASRFLGLPVVRLFARLSLLLRLLLLLFGLRLRPGGLPLHLL